MPDSVGKRQSSPKNPSKERNKNKPTREIVKDKDSDPTELTPKLDENVSDGEVVSEPQETMLEANEKSTEPEVKVVSLPDVMRNEPILVSLIVSHYEGETNDLGFYHGDGYAEFYGGHSYNGAFNDGKMHGKGRYTWNDGVCYVGEFKNNVISGTGQYFWPDGSFYEGDVSNGKRHGKGKFHFAPTKSIYDGDWVNGKRSGRGILYFKGNLKSYYDGNWIDNRKCGHGIMVYKSGNKYEGMWVSDLRHGKGHMYWYDTGEEYKGDWLNGAMTGLGTYTWYINRANNSQYPLRNQYHGQFINGVREGCGTFHYASGAFYSGQWLKNLKHGKGTFTFKNGITFDGNFEKDRIVGHPDMVLSGFATPDIDNSGLPVRSQTPIRSGSPNGTMDTIEINLAPLYQEHNIDIEYQVMETEEVSRIVLQHISSLRSIYRFYSSLGKASSLDNTYILTLLQMWRLLKDTGIRKLGLSLADIDRLVVFSKDNRSNPHYPYRKIFFREFINMLIVVAFHVCGKDFTTKGVMFSSSLSKYLVEYILPNACSVNGSFFSELSNSLAVHPHLDFCHQFYIYFLRRKRLPNLESDECLTMRDFLLIIKDLKLINENLPAESIICSLLSDLVTNESKLYECNLNFELVFLDVLESLIDCSQFFVTDYICESTLRKVEQPPVEETDHTLQELNGLGKPTEDVPTVDTVNAPSNSHLTTLLGYHADQVEDSSDNSLNISENQEKLLHGEKGDKKEEEDRHEKGANKERSKETPKSSDGKYKSRKENRGGLSSDKQEKRERTESKHTLKKSSEAIMPRRERSKDHSSAHSPEGKQKPMYATKETTASEREDSAPPIIITSSSEQHIKEIETTPEVQSGARVLSPKQSVLMQDSGHPLLLTQSLTSLEMWSLKVKIFFENYLQPAFYHYRKVDEILESKNLDKLS